MSKTTAPYLAGFVDGEGYLGILKIKKGEKKDWSSANAHYFKPVIKIANTDKAIIQWLYDSYGGSFEMRLGKGNSKTSYCWSLKSVYQLEKFIRAIKPFLRIKQEQATILLEFIKTVNKGLPLKHHTNEKREELYTKIRELNHRDILHRERLSEPTPI